MRQDAFERLYSEHAAALLGFLIYRTGDRALAEDLIADTFERVIRTRVRFDPRRGSEKTWLYTIALNLLRDHVRREDSRRRATELAVPVSAAEPAGTAAVDDRDELERALSNLGTAEQDAIALRYGAGLAFAEIARLTGEKPATVESRVYRALRRLRDSLEGG